LLVYLLHLFLVYLLVNVTIEHFCYLLTSIFTTKSNHTEDFGQSGTAQSNYIEDFGQSGTVPVWRCPPKTAGEEEEEEEEREEEKEVEALPLPAGLAR